MATAAANARAMRLIALTNRAPVKIFVDEWPTIAEARGDSFRGPDYSRYAQRLHHGELDLYTIEVLQHRDGCALVCAIIERADKGGIERRGELLQEGANLPEAIQRVGKDCELPDRVIRACINHLPAEDLTTRAPARPENVAHSGRVTERAQLSDTERCILHRLTEMLPTSARSYEQALRDVASADRISWRGTGTELREVLREVLDHLAPGEKVRSAGFQLEEGQSRPTQKQKARFILSSRRSLREAVEATETTLDRVEEAIASLVRTTYRRGSVSTHTATDLAEIRRLKTYVDALLLDLLEDAQPN